MTQIWVKEKRIKKRKTRILKLMNITSFAAKKKMTLSGLQLIDMILSAGVYVLSGAIDFDSKYS